MYDNLNYIICIFQDAIQAMFKKYDLDEYSTN